MKTAISFKPVFHTQDSKGNWWVKPIDPALSGSASDEAKRLTEAGETVLILDADSVDIPAAFR